MREARYVHSVASESYDGFSRRAGVKDHGRKRFPPHKVVDLEGLKEAQFEESRTGPSPSTPFGRQRPKVEPEFCVWIDGRGTSIGSGSPPSEGWRPVAAGVGVRRGRQPTPAPPALAPPRRGFKFLIACVERPSPWTSRRRPFFDMQNSGRNSRS